MTLPNLYRLNPFKQSPLLHSPKLPLRFVLTVPFMLLTVGTTGLVGYLSWQNGQRSINQLAAELGSEIAARVVQYLDTDLTSPILVNRINADAVHIGNLDLQNLPNLERYFLTQIRQFDGVSQILFGNEKGDFRAVCKAAYACNNAAFSLLKSDPADPTQIYQTDVDNLGRIGDRVHSFRQPKVQEHPWYQAAVEAKRPVRVPIFVLGDQSGLALNASYPIYDQTTRQLLGVFSAASHLSDFNQFMAGLQVGRTGRVFIIERNGYLVGSSTGQLPYTINQQNGQKQLNRIQAIDSSDALIQATSRYLLSYFKDFGAIQSPQHLDVLIDREHQFVQVVPYKDAYGLDWLIVIAVPKADFMGQINANTRTTLLFSLGALLGAMGLGFWLSRLIARPIQRLGKSSLALAEGEWDKVTQQKSAIAELQTLNTSFDRMAVQLQQSFNRVRNALQESEEKFTTVFRTCPDPLSILTLEGQYLDVNEAFVDLFGYSRDELIGSNASAIGYWINADQRKYYLQALQAGERIRNQEFTFRKKTGELLTVLLSTEQIELQGQPYRLGIAKEITDRKQLELALQRSEAKLNQVMNSVIASIASFRLFADRHWEYEYWSEGCEAVFGYTVQEFMADPTLWISHVFPEDLELGRVVDLDQLMANHPVALNGEYRFYHKDGSLRWISYRLKCEPFDDGQYWIGTVVDIDISDRKRTEEAIQQQAEREQLLRTITQRMRQSLDLDEILTAAVTEVRQTLQADRALIIHLTAEGSGIVLKEAVLPEYPVAKTMVWDNQSFSENCYDYYCQGKPRIVLDVALDDWADCPREFIQAVGMKSKVIAPITQRDEEGVIQVWGLLAVHACGDYRQWQPIEAEFLQQIANQLAIAIQQANLYQQVQIELADRKQAEAALRQSEARFQRLVAAAPGAIYTLVRRLDESFYFEYVSPAIEAINEFTAEQMLIDPVLNLIHPDDQKSYEAAVARSALTLEAFSHEFRIITPSGKLKWLQASSRPEQRENGEIAWYGIVLDVSDRKQAEEALRQSEERNRAMLSAIPDLMKLYTPDGIYLDSIKGNSTFDLIPEDETLIGKHLSELIPSDIAATQLQLIQQAVITGEVQVYEQQVWFQDTLQYEEVRVVPCSSDTILLLIRNITDRKLAEAALRQSEAALRRAQLVAHVGSWKVEVHTEQVTWSEESFHIFGWDVTQPEPSLSQFYDLVHPDDRAALQQIVADTIASGDSYKTEFRAIHPDGSVRYVEARGEAIRNEQGQIVQLLGTNLDITERQQAEAALRQSEATKNQILKAIPDLIIWMTDDGTYIDFIDGTNVIGPYARSEVIGKNLYDLLPPDLATIRMNAIQQARQTGEMQIYEQHFSIQDDIRYEEVRVISVGGDRVLVIVRDITDRKQAEAALLDSETRFRSAFSDAPIGMGLIGLDDRWIKVNPMLCDMLGFLESELLKMPVSSLVHPDDTNKFQQCIQQVLSNENRNAQVELRYCCNQGRLAWGLVSLSLVRDPYNQPLYYVAQIQDITERQAIDRLKNEFISIVSHELRTPLTAIRGFLGLLDTGLYDNQPNKAKHMIKQALSNSDRLVRLVNDILDLERLSSGRVQWVMEVCEANDLMQRAVAGVQSLADEADITLAIELTLSPTVHVWADPDTIIQTLTNLLSNAIKFSPPHSVITLSAEGQSDVVLFSVEDHGRGIPADKLETIFGRFQQVDVSDSRQKGGTGLGLAICQSIVQQHGGHIWVESTLGEGSTFYFTLLKPPISRV